MLVYAEFPRSRQAPQALYLAAQVHRALGEVPAVDAALRELIDNYEQDAKNEWVAKARKELADRKAS